MRHILTSMLLLGLCLGSTTASATIARQANLKELVGLSDRVLVGTIGARESYWEGTRIYTRVEVSVDEHWVGPNQQATRLAVTTLGGIVGEIGQQVVGTPKLTRGNQFVLFLKRAPQKSNEWLVVGMAQGAFQIKPTQHTITPVQRNLGGLALTGPRHVFPTDLVSLKRQVMGVSHD